MFEKITKVFEKRSRRTGVIGRVMPVPGYPYSLDTF
jgi:hypothetical protein